jgi:hypothetical protein
MGLQGSEVRILSPRPLDLTQYVFGIGDDSFVANTLALCVPPFYTPALRAIERPRCVLSDEAA